MQRLGTQSNLPLRIGESMYYMDCPHCKGTGAVKGKTVITKEEVYISCATCHGTGTVEIED